jgi:hypothetical protein
MNTITDEAGPNAEEAGPNAESVNAESVTLLSQIETALGVTDKFLLESGSFETGFFHNELVIDLEELQAGNLSAFALIKDVHDTAGTSFREHYGIDKCYKLPDGVDVSAIANFCANIFETRDTLTLGFSVKWDGSNQIAVWDDDTEEVYAAWKTIGEQIGDLPAMEVYDLSESENLPFVKEAIFADGWTGKTQVEILERLYVVYPTDNDSVIFTEYFTAAEKIAAEIVEEESQEEESQGD